ncbi:ribosome small subunit-dependent GTPase A [Algoriphagus halophytocola]|uniref:Small ribosomal subunit biogenesis GTPase RsgA n=1 Tax=Algoriphagus halophytocola TaxID=2991499 RepID=A0ABY6MBN9_9BACT|nr:MULTISPECIES: ribosome small subunit-dependent GTPase A [unclassified Algoriphagus]UZD20970.1 ribosome small subunit-dependent GTPase A [Algoriphagus sp. TR-M5]WBL42136.1 ribosome small subunit-dependent GTPase A [Algoriphagus sp. TR-M9]
MKGRVIKSTGSWYSVQVGESVLSARLKGKFKQDELKLTNPIAVGDWVELAKEPNQETAVISEILPRENYVIRKSTRKQHFSHIIASNVDQAILVITMKSPRTSLGFIDRFLVSTESFRIPAILVVNKRDLMSGEKAEDWLLDIYEIYKPLGYQVMEVSAASDLDLKEKFEPILANKSTLISGHSGVGKSTLLNALVPEAKQHTQEISGFTAKGVHTTTFAELFALDNGGDLIDTPGIKEFGILDIEDQELSHYFPEMRAFLGKCKYNNCQHLNEPGCVVLEKLAEGYIHPYRYESYVNILNEEDDHR